MRRMPSMGNLHYRLNFDPGKMSEIFHHSSKEHVKLVELPSLVTECFKMLFRGVIEYFVYLAWIKIWPIMQIAHYLHYHPNTNL